MLVKIVRTEGHGLGAVIEIAGITVPVIAEYEGNPYTQGDHECEKEKEVG